MLPPRLDRPEREVGGGRRRLGRRVDGVWRGDRSSRLRPRGCSVFLGRDGCRARRRRRRVEPRAPEPRDGRCRPALGRGWRAPETDRRLWEWPSRGPRTEPRPRPPAGRRAPRGRPPVPPAPSSHAPGASRSTPPATVRRPAGATPARSPGGSRERAARIPAEPPAPGSPPAAHPRPRRRRRERGRERQTQLPGPAGRSRGPVGGDRRRHRRLRRQPAARRRRRSPREPRAECGGWPGRRGRSPASRWTLSAVAPRPPGPGRASRGRRACCPAPPGPAARARQAPRRSPLR